MKRSPFFKMLVPLAVVFLLIACEKDDDPTQPGTSKLAVVHAAAGTSSFDILLNNSPVSTSSIPFGSNSGTVGNPYFTGTPGLNNLRFNAAGNPLFQANFLADANLNYTVFAYDTLGSGSGTTGILLSDALLTTGTDSAFIRLLHLSHDAGVVDVELIQPSSNTIVADSVVFVGSNLNVAVLSQFSKVRSGNYSVIVKNNGTANIIYTNNINLTAGKSYTLFAKGSRSAAITSPYSFGIGQFLHN